MLRRMAIVCVLVVPASGPAVAAGDTKHGSAKKHGSKKHGSAKQHASATRECVGASLTAVDEATRRKASKVVLCLVNRERRAHRVRPLRRNRPLAKAARRHSAAMVIGKYFSHASPGGDVLSRATRSGYVLRRSRHTLLGETLSWGAGSGATPARLVASFMSSPAHRRTLLSRRFRDLGIGLALGAPATNVADSAATLTLNFGRR